MSDEGDLRTSTFALVRPHPNKLALPQNGHIPHKENTARSNEIGERSLSP